MEAFLPSLIMSNLLILHLIFVDHDLLLHKGFINFRKKLFIKKLNLQIAKNQGIPVLVKYDIRNTCFLHHITRKVLEEN